MQVIRQYRTFIQTAPPNLPSTSSTSTTINEPQSQVQADLSTNDTKPNPASQYRYVTFLPDDPSNPQNWSLAYKSWLVIQLGILSVSLTFASSISSAAALGARGELGGGELAGVATTGAFVVGIGLGAMPFAPLSECRLSPLLPYCPLSQVSYCYFNSLSQIPYCYFNPLSVTLLVL